MRASVAEALAALPFVASVEALTTCGSTNDVARARAESGAQPWTVVMADAQTAGRGRAGRAWWSPPGEHLYLSVILRPNAAPEWLAPLTLQVALAMGDAVYEITRARPTLKWPNDVLVQGRKVGGALTELVLHSGGTSVIVGVGLNVAPIAPEAPADLHAIGLSSVAVRTVSRTEAAVALLRALHRRVGHFEQSGFDPADWQAFPSTVGHRVTVQSPGAPPVTGLALNLRSDGALLVLVDGIAEPLAVTVGDVTLEAS